MLRPIRLLIYILIAIIWFVFVLPYFLVQTEFGSKLASDLISKYNQEYNISIGRVSHSIITPYELTLENITIQAKQSSSNYLSAKKIVVGLKADDLWQHQSFDYIFIENGDLNLSAVTADNLSANFVQLNNVSIYYQDPELLNQLTLNNVYGAIKPWSNQLITERQDSLFNFTIQKLTYNNLNLQSVAVKGLQKNKELRTTSLGGQLSNGFFTAKITIPADNSLDINQLKIDNINFQSSIDSLNFDQLLQELPKTTVHDLSVLDSTISIPNLSIEKANLNAKNLIYDNQLQLQKSDLVFNAQSIVWQDELIEKPLLIWHSQDNNTIIEQAIATWSKGNIKLNGTWHDNLLTIDNLISTGIRYQLPENWYHSLFNFKLSNKLPNITINQFMLMPSLLIDTNPELPFQFTAFEAFGNNIKIENQSDTQTQVSGHILIKSSSATLNTVELDKPDLNLTITPENKKLTFSALINDGIVEGKAEMTRENQINSFELNAHKVSSEVLSLWHLVNNPIKTKKFSLYLNGQLPTNLNGVLETNNTNYAIENNFFK